MSFYSSLIGFDYNDFIFFFWKSKATSVFNSSGWVVLGEPYPDNTKSYSEHGFQGYLSRVQIWGRSLDFTNEIQKQV